MKRKYHFIVTNKSLLEENCEAEVLGYEIGPIELKDTQELSPIKLGEKRKFLSIDAVQLKKINNECVLIEVLEKNLAVTII